MHLEMTDSLHHYIIWIMMLMIFSALLLYSWVTKGYSLLNNVEFIHCLNAFHIFYQNHSNYYMYILNLLKKKKKQFKWKWPS